MAWNDANELVVAGTGQVYVAPVGTTLPTATDDTLNAAFVGLGYTTEDGVTFTVAPEVNDYMAWQSRQPIRRELVNQTVSAAFSLLQWNEETVPLAFGGGAVTQVGSDYRYDFPTADDALDERAMVIDVTDGDRNMRFVLPRGNVTDSVEAQFVRTEMAVLPITFGILEPIGGGAPGYILFDDSDAFAAGS